MATDCGQRYVLFATDFKPLTGGVAEYLHNLWNEVAKKLPVMVLTTVDDKGKTWERAYRHNQLPSPPERRLGERFGDSFPPFRKMNTLLYFGSMRRYAEMVAILIKKEGGSEVFLGSWWGELSHFLCRALKKQEIPYSVHVHGLEIVFPFYGKLPQWRRSDLREAKAIYANSNGTADLVRVNIGSDLDVNVVNPGVRKGEPCSGIDAHRGELARRFVLGGKRILLTVARLVPRKGIDLVIRSVAELSRDFPDLCYVIVGDGPDRERLMQLAGELEVSEKVIFVGEADNLTKTTFYELCDVFVMPNRVMGGLDWEGFGIVFLEAAVAGKPCIGGNNGGVSDAVEHGVSGLLVDTGRDEKETTAALRKLLGNDDLRERLGRSARERAETRFSWRVIGAGFLELLVEAKG